MTMSQSSGYVDKDKLHAHVLLAFLNTETQKFTVFEILKGNAQTKIK